MDLPNVAEAVIGYAKDHIEVYPQHVNRASQAGHPCEKYLVLLRTSGGARTPHDVGLEFIFQRGRAVEDVAFKELRKAGFTIVESQRFFEWKELYLTGKIDGKIEVGGEHYPVEVKSLSQWDVPKLNCMEDFLKSPKLWLQKYPAQLTLYMLMDNKEWGLFYIKDGTNWRPKSIWVQLDYAYAEGLCKKLERVNAHVAAGTTPEGVNDVAICPQCDLYHVCLPPITADAIALEDDEALLEQLDRLMELKTAHAEYESINRGLKGRLEGVEKALVGNYLITGKWVEVAEQVRPASKHWRKTIELLSEAGKEET